MVCLVGPRAWFNTASTELQTSRSGTLVAVTNIAGYTFTNDPVSAEIKQALKTSHILNGTFFRSAKESDCLTENPESKEFRVFLATWPAEDRVPMVMLGHTPDICWRGAGWEPLDLGQPRTVQISILHEQPPVLPPNETAQIFSRRERTFELRIFSSPSNEPREIVLWCSLVGRQQLRATDSAENLENRLQTYVFRTRQFFGAVHDRVSVLGGKQFVRFSVSLTTDWQSAVDELRAFSQLWLREKL